jgi:hypothetical protein
MSEFDPERILGALHEAGVEFVLIGGLAAVVHGSSLTTADVDVTPERSPENLERLASRCGRWEPGCAPSRNRTGCRSRSTPGSWPRSRRC